MTPAGSVKYLFSISLIGRGFSRSSGDGGIPHRRNVSRSANSVNPLLTEPNYLLITATLPETGSSEFKDDTECIMNKTRVCILKFTLNALYTMLSLLYCRITLPISESYNVFYQNKILASIIYHFVNILVPPRTFLSSHSRAHIKQTTFSTVKPRRSCKIIERKQLTTN